jgi:mannitol/fructose-specific phosphotransferase system IIA component
MDPALTAAAIGVGGTVIVGIAGFWASVRNTNKTTALTHRVLQLTEQGQVTNQYTQAVEQLGDNKAPVRLGELYALERFAQDNPAHRQTTVDVICAYLRMPFPHCT